MGDFVTAAGSPGSNQLQFDWAEGICYNHRDNNLYVADNCNHRVQVLTTDLRFVRSIGTKGSGNGQFKYPTYIAFDNANNMYVTDHKNNRVQVLTTDGQFLRAFSQKANGQKLHKPRTIAIDSSNTVYVSEYGSKCVSVFTSQGAYITTFGTRGSEEGQFEDILGIFVDQNDHIAISDIENGLMQIF